MVTDIGDAVIMKQLFDTLWDLKVILVTTSNRAPQELYKNGIQREIFEPFLDDMEEKNSIIDIQSDKDHRMEAFKNSQGSISSKSADAEFQTYYHPNDDKTKQIHNDVFQELAGGHIRNLQSKEEVEVIEGRSLWISGYKKICTMNYNAVFNGNFGASDFIAICRHFEAVLLSDLEPISLADRNLARRFILFIDECYNHKVKLYCFADKP